MKRREYAQGAKIKSPYICEPSPKLEHLYMGLRSENEAAYELAMANRHKPWARRWLKQRRFTGAA